MQQNSYDFREGDSVFEYVLILGPHAPPPHSSSPMT